MRFWRAFNLGCLLATVMIIVISVVSWFVAYSREYQSAKAYDQQTHLERLHWCYWTVSRSGIVFSYGSLQGQGIDRSGQMADGFTHPFSIRLEPSPGAKNYLISGWGCLFASPMRGLKEYVFAFPLPLLLLLTGYPTWREAKRIWRSKYWCEGMCPQCGYDLRATPTRCPECGTEQTAVEKGV